MTRARFALLGYDNPLGRYPAPVVPVGRLDGRLVAAYSGAQSPSYLALEDDVEYVKFDGAARGKLAAFDPHVHRLFAFGEWDVRLYPIAREGEVFSEFLNQKNFSGCNPFLRLSLAKVTNDSRLIIRELRSCVLWMHNSAPALLDSWYQSQLGSLVQYLSPGLYAAIPGHWRALPGVSESIATPSGARPERAWAAPAWGARGAADSGALALSCLALLTLFALAYTAGWAFTLLATIVLMHAVILAVELRDHPRGYTLHAARRIWRFLLAFVAVEWAAGVVIFQVVLSTFYAVPDLKSPVAFMIGFAIAPATTTVLEKRLLTGEGIMKSLVRPRTRQFLRITLRHAFARAIQYCVEADVADCQRPDAWGLGITPEQLNRRIRVLYETYKTDIARARRDPAFLRYDVGRTGLEMLYLLIRHLGRDRLRESLKNPAGAYYQAWDGRERRRVAGTKEDRDAALDLHPERSRVYDHERLVDGPEHTTRQDKESSPRGSS